MEISEKNFEQTIEAVLLMGGPDAPTRERPMRERALAGEFAPGGYRQRKPEDYDRALCLDTRLALDFIYATQPKEWAKFLKQYGNEAKDKFLQRLDHDIRQHGTLHVLRKGIKANGCKFKLAYFRPSSGLNEALQQLYNANIFSIMRQVKFSQKNENSLDTVLFLNGLPVFTVELKNPLTGQNVEDAVKQYRETRDPREPLFAFKRCLAHFCVDSDLVMVTTRLEGPKTHFLPFNLGRNRGAGNPLSITGYATAYLWESIWARDSVLNLIDRFIQFVDVLDDKGEKTGEQALIFPRYHQLDAVRRLVADARARGAGQHYLIQHSAGSGKSNTIAWLAHQLSILHDAQDRRAFDSIVVISDRRVIDRQLQATVKQFEQTLGVVENIDKTSRQLKEALQDGKTIIVTTLQKFPVIYKQISELRGKRFGVLIDEAHSSQGGEGQSKLKVVLAPASLQEAEQADSAQEDDIEDRILQAMRKRGRLPNVSFFAFTATPKPETLGLFGTLREDGAREPFSLYTMRQAIEERFILDVLENYTTYKAYWNLLKKIQDDPHYDRRKATRLLTAFVEMDEHAIEAKVEIMVEHFVGQVMGRIGGKAKAMIVTRSRLHAARYKQAVDKYIQQKGYSFKTLVAFSGTVKDGGIDYTESNMNGFPESKTAETFKRDEYRLLIVAEKFQTGFDQPLLHTMYVDKRLVGLHAVQTISRLNRIYSGKEETMVLDFANEAEDIQKAFEPYYDRALLSEDTDPNVLYDLQTRLADFQFYTEAEVNRFAEVYFNPKGTQDKLHAALAPAVERYREAGEDDRVAFRGHLQDYVRLYAYLSQVITFVDADLERLYVYGRLLLRKLPVSRERLPVEIQQNIDIESYRLQKTSSGKIKLERGSKELEPVGPRGPALPMPEEIEPLSRIIQELNERFGIHLGDDVQNSIWHLQEALVTDPALEASMRVNAPENARLTFNHVVNDRLQEMVEGHFQFYKLVNDDPEVAKELLDWLFEQYQKRLKGQG